MTMNDERGMNDYERVLFSGYPGINVLGSIENTYVRYKYATSPSDRIFERNHPFELYGIDRWFLLVAGLAASRQGRLLLQYPYTGYRSLPLMVLQLLYALRGKADRNQVLLFTKGSTGFLEEYRRLVLSGSGSPIYKEVFPLLDFAGEQRNGNGSSGRRPGHEEASERDAWSRPSLMISKSPFVLPLEPHRVACAIVDLDKSVFQRKSELADLGQWISENGVKSTLYISSDPFGEIEHELAMNGVDTFGWGRSGIQNEPIGGRALAQDALNPFSIPFSEWQVLKSVPHWIFLKIQDATIEGSLDKVWAGLAGPTRSSHTAPAFDVITEKTKATIYTMLRTPAPLAYYEKFRESQYLPTIMDHIERLDYDIEELSGEFETATDSLRGIAAGVHEIYETLKSKENGKGKAVLKVIGEAEGQAKSISIVASEGGYVRALTDYLLDCGLDVEGLAQHGIEITVPAGLKASAARSASVFTFCPPWSDAKTVFKPASKNTGFVCYRPEFFGLKKLLNHEENTVEDMLSAPSRSRLLFSLLGPRVTERQTEYLNRYASVGRTVPQVDEIYVIKQGAKPRHWSASPLLEDSIFEEGQRLTLEEHGTAEEEEEEFETGNYEPDIGPEEEVAAYKVAFNDGTYLLAYEDSIVQVINVGAEGFLTRRIKNLRSGEVVALVNSGIRTTIIDALTRRIDRDSRMRPAVNLRKKWIESLRSGMKAHSDTPDKLLAKLKLRGSEIAHPMTIYLWERELVIGPRNKFNIKLVGEVYRDEFLISRFQEINNAIERLRHIHRVLAQRLRRLAGKVALAKDSAQYNGEDLVDADMELCLKDLESIIKLARVRSIEGPIKMKLKQLGEIVSA